MTDATLENGDKAKVPLSGTLHELGRKQASWGATTDGAEALKGGFSSLPRALSAAPST